MPGLSKKSPPGRVAAPIRAPAAKAAVEPKKNPVKRPRASAASVEEGKHKRSDDEEDDTSGEDEGGRGRGKGRGASQPAVARGRPPGEKTKKQRDMKANAAAAVKTVASGAVAEEDAARKAEKAHAARASRTYTREELVALFPCLTVVEAKEYKEYYGTPKIARTQPALLLCTTCYEGAHKPGKAFLVTCDYYQILRHVTRR